MKKHLLLLFAALLPLVASAQTKVEIDGIWYNLTAETREAEMTYKGDSYDSYDDEYSGSINIPATVTYNDVAYSVTSIGDDAFYDCSSLTAITIPEGVTSIGDEAFYDCSSLTAITIPEGVTSIGNWAFESCISLTAITIPEGVTSIGDGAFVYCSSLTAITIPEGVTSIGYGAFVYCSGLTSIVVAKGNKVYDSRGDCNAIIETNSNTLIKGCATTIIPEGVTSIGNNAFGACSGLTSIVVAKGNKVYDSRGDCNAIIETNSNTLIQGCATTIIPEGVTSIGDYAFVGCTSLTAITIPEGVTRIGESAFSWCENLTAITLPESVTSIEGGAFDGCSNLTAITIPEGVTSIGDYAFDDCSSLTAITLPEGVTSIGVGAFSNCGSLTAITIPASVTSIGEWAFAACSGLTDVYCYAEEIPYTDSEAFNGSCIEYATLHVPASAMDAYKNTAPWSRFGTIKAIEKGGTTGILTIPAKPVLIQCQGGVITLSGLDEGTAVAAYSTAGTELATATATDGTATLTTNLTAGTIAIVKTGDYSIKVAIK